MGPARAFPIAISICLFASICAGAGEEEDLLVCQQAAVDGLYEVSRNASERFLEKYPASPKANQVRLILGRSFYELGNLHNALFQFETVLKNSTEGGLLQDALYWTGEVQFKGKDYANAKLTFSRLVAEYPESGYLDYAYYSLGWASFEQGEFESALENFERCISRGAAPVGPANSQVVADALYKKAESLYALNRWQEAKTVFGDFLNAHPKSKMAAYCYYYLGDVAYRTSSYYEACLDLKEAISISSNDANVPEKDKIKEYATHGLGWAYYAQGKYQDAIGLLNEFPSLVPNSRLIDSSRLCVGLCQMRLKDAAGAIGQFDELLEKGKDTVWHLEALFWKAEALAQLNRYDEARDTYNQILASLKEGNEALKLEVFDPEGKLSGLRRVTQDDVHYNIGWIYIRQERYEDAIDEFRHVADRSRNEILRASALCNIGDTNLDAEKFDEAIASYDEVLRGYPESYYANYAQFQLAQALMASGNYLGAALALKALLLNYPDSKYREEASFFIGEAYFALGNFESAVEYYEKFISQYPKSKLNLQAQFKEASALVNMKSYERALKLLTALAKETSGSELGDSALYKLGEVYWELKNERKSKEVFEAYLSKYAHGKNAQDVLAWLGRYWFARKKNNLAQGFFERLLKEFPKSSPLLAAEAYYYQGVLAVSAGNIDGAFDFFKKAAQDFPETRFAHLSYGEMANSYISQGRYQDAISALRSAIGSPIAERNPELQFLIGDCIEKTGDRDGAILEYLKLTYLYPMSREWVIRAQLRCAEIFESVSKWQEAKKMYEEIVSSGAAESKFARERLSKLGVSRGEEGLGGVRKGE